METDEEGWFGGQGSGHSTPQTSRIFNLRSGPIEAESSRLFSKYDVGEHTQVMGGGPCGGGREVLAADNERKFQMVGAV